MEIRVALVEALIHVGGVDTDGEQGSGDCGDDGLHGCASLTVEAYLDGKPAARGKQKHTRHQRDSAFWSSRFVREIPDDAWHSDWLTLALARYLGQERVANPSLLERIAATAPRVVHRAVRFSGLVLRATDSRQFCRTVDAG